MLTPFYRRCVRFYRDHAPSRNGQGRFVADQQVLPVREAELTRWRKLPLARQVAENQRRLDEHVIRFEQLRHQPMGAGTADQFTVIFQHVPKTGGTTLEYLLAKNYTINGVLHINAPALEANPQALFKKGALPHVIMGHHKTSQLLYRFVDRPTVHLTMLRDPVKRVLSYFDYLQTSTSHALHEKARERSLEAFIDGKDMVELSNAQTLRIAGLLKRHWLKKPDLAHALAQAKASVERHFTLVGPTERYTEYLLMGQRTLGWRDIYYERRNVSKRKTRPEDVPATLLERIRERNAEDIELYAFVCKLFDERCQALGIDEQAVEQFHTRNRQYQELLAADEQ